MGRKKISVDQGLAFRAEEDLRRLEDYKISYRLIVIAQAGQRPVEAVARDFKLSSRSIFRWADSYKKRGVKGLKDRPRGHNPSKLNENHKRQIAEWLKNNENPNGNHTKWTLDRIRIEIEKEFGISLSIMPLWRHLRQMGLK